jgi:serine/threonine protein kinase/Tfp pilus assembly protein PilF
VTVECPICCFENPDDTTFCGKCASPLKEQDDATEAPTATLNIMLQEFKTGSIVADRYKIIERLGKGGMGQVYKVHDLDVGEKIALKLIRPEIAANARIIARFQNELRLARKISHRNVCRMFDLSRDGNTKFITMEYVSGEDLKATIKRMGPLTWKRAVSIGKQLCQGLSEAHRMGVIHRDLKCRNIMIDREGSVRIMDFGIALSQESEGITKSGVIIGTPQYLSPEQVDGKKIDSRTDIYSMGIILYEMVTGKVPFEGDSTYSIAFKQKMEAPKVPWELNPEIPLELGRLILKCLAKDPDKRPQTAEEVCMELTRMEEGATTMERPSRLKLLLEKIRMRFKFTRFPRLLLLLGLVAVLGYLGIRQVIPPKAAVGTRGSEAVSTWTSSVIVLPFRLENPDAVEESLRQTISDRIIRNLSKFREIRAINSWTSWSYKDSSFSPKDIATENGVNHVLWGTLGSTEDYLHIETELLSTPGGHILWTDSYQCSIDANLFEVLDSVAKTVASTLGVDMVDTRYPGIKPKDSVDLAAIEFYREGKNFENRYLESGNPTDFKACIDNYQQAIAIDPEYALVHWRLGMAYEVKFNRDKEEHDLSIMYRYLQKAYDIDPNLAEANVGMGWMYFYHEDHEKAYAYYQQAFQLDANNAEVNHNVGSFLRSLGLFDQALAHYTRAISLDPIPEDFALWNRILADCYIKLGRVPEAADFLRKAMESRPDYRFNLDLAECLMRMGDYVGAAEEIASARNLLGNPGAGLSREVLLLAATGKREQALALIPELERSWPNRPAVTCALALLGKKEEAIKRITTGGEEQFEKQHWYPYSFLFLENNPFYNSLREEPDFQVILRRERDVYQERLKKFGEL